MHISHNAWLPGQSHVATLSLHTIKHIARQKDLCIIRDIIFFKSILENISQQVHLINQLEIEVSHLLTKGFVDVFSNLPVMLPKQERLRCWCGHT